MWDSSSCRDLGDLALEWSISEQEQTWKCLLVHSRTGFSTQYEEKNADTSARHSKKEYSFFFFYLFESFSCRFLVDYKPTKQASFEKRNKQKQAGIQDLISISLWSRSSPEKEEPSLPNAPAFLEFNLSQNAQIIIHNWASFIVRWKKSSWLLSKVQKKSRGLRADCEDSESLLRLVQNGVWWKSD